MKRDRKNGNIYNCVQLYLLCFVLVCLTCMRFFLSLMYFHTNPYLWDDLDVENPTTSVSWFASYRGEWGVKIGPADFRHNSHGLVFGHSFYVQSLCPFFCLVSEFELLMLTFSRLCLGLLRSFFSICFVH